MTAKRNLSLDAIAGLLIIYMILLHVCQHANMMNEPFIKYLGYILFFFMPWFFFKSGMFYKKNNTRELITKCANQLLVPFVIYSVIGHILYCLIIWNEGDRNWIHYMVSPFKQILTTGALAGNLPLWFLLTLFTTRLIYNFLPNKLLYRSGFTLLFGAFAYLLYRYTDIHITILANVCSGLFFYGCGNLFRQMQYNAAVLVVALLILGLQIAIPSNVDMHNNSLTRGMYPIWILTSLCGCIIINFIFKALPRLQILNFIGRNSLEFYVTHWNVILLAKICIVYIFNIHDKLVIFYTMIAFCAIGIPVIIHVKSRINYASKE